MACDDVRSRELKYDFCGLLSESNFEILFLNRLVQFRRDLLKETEGLSQSEYEQFYEVINPETLNCEYYSETHHGNLTFVEKLSISTTKYIEKILDRFKDGYEPLDVESFTDVFVDYDFIKYCQSMIDKINSLEAFGIENELENELENEKKNKRIMYFFEKYTQAIINHPAAKNYRSFDNSRRNKRKHFKTDVLQCIVEQYHGEYNKRPTLEFVLNVIENDHCGEGKLISCRDDIDRDEGTMYYYDQGFKNSNSSRRVKFKTLDNQISKIYKKISS